MTSFRAMLPDSIDDLDTPVALVDLDVFERNARSIASFLDEHGMRWRPHTKAHKSPRLARLQQAAGATGVTCAKLGEAEAMVAGGLDHILIANHLGAAIKWERLAALQRQAEVIACVDHLRHIELAEAAATAEGTVIPLIIEADVGMGRVGVRSVDEARTIAAAARDAQGVRLVGIMGYEGHLLTTWPEAVKRARCREDLAVLARLASELRDAGHEIDIVSSGGTGSFRQTAGLPELTESQAGGGCLMDRFYAEECHVDLDLSLSLVATVVSVRDPDHAIMDAGFKSLGSNQGMPLPRVEGRPGVEVTSLSAEHGTLRTQPDVPALRIGDRVRLVAGYSDAMLIMHDHVIGHRDSRPVELIELAGRGRLT